MKEIYQIASRLLLALSIGLMPQLASGMGKLEGSEWGFSGQDTPFVRFEAGHRISGHGGCNRFFGQYKLGKDGAIKIGPLASTRKHCGDAAMKTETDFMNALEASRRCLRKTGQLEIYGARGESLLELVHRDWD